MRQEGSSCKKQQGSQAQRAVLYSRVSVQAGLPVPLETVTVPLGVPLAGVSGSTRISTQTGNQPYKCLKDATANGDAGGCRIDAQ